MASPLDRQPSKGSLSQAHPQPADSVGLSDEPQEPIGNPTPLNPPEPDIRDARARTFSDRRVYAKTPKGPNPFRPFTTDQRRLTRRDFPLGSVHLMDPFVDLVTRTRRSGASRALEFYASPLSEAYILGTPSSRDKRDEALSLLWTECLDNFSR